MSRVRYIDDPQVRRLLAQSEEGKRALALRASSLEEQARGNTNTARFHYRAAERQAQRVLGEMKGRIR